MSRILQIVIDTNILVAAFRSQRGVANFLLTNLNDARWQVNVSTPLLLEYEDVLKRPAMSGFVGATEVDIFLRGLCAITVNHDIFLSLASAGKRPRRLVFVGACCSR